MSKTKTAKKNAAPRSAEKTTPNRSGAAPPVVSGKWLAGAVGIMLVGATVCVWAALCLMFWQGNWQLLYHPRSAVTRTPADVGVPFNTIGLATTEAGLSQLKGWWIPAEHDARFTAIYLHGGDGNLSDNVDQVEQLHAAGLTVLAFDYRGYGQSQFERPSEARWREDVEGAIEYLIGTRHVAAGSIVLVGQGLGADLALETGASHPDLAGIVLDELIAAPTDAIFQDPRARMVPAHWLVKDRWDMSAPAAGLRIPSLWFDNDTRPETKNTQGNPAAYKLVTSPKMIVWLSNSGNKQKDYADALSRWLDDLPVRH
jgi:pimeloyl-ACP methyl ester carboxylesterase